MGNKWRLKIITTNLIDQYLFNLQKYKYFSFSKIFVILQILEYFFFKKN